MLLQSKHINCKLTATLSITLKRIVPQTLVNHCKFDQVKLASTCCIETSPGHILRQPHSLHIRKPLIKTTACMAGGAPVGKVVCPGDVVLHLPEDGTLLLGPGLQPNDKDLFAVRAGTLCSNKKGKLWVQSSQKRYSPAKGDPVVGIITERYADTYHVNIEAAFPAMLPALAFEGATRRNRPNLKVGDLVYSCVESSPPGLETTLTCIGPFGKAEGYGPLTGGHCFRVETGYAHTLLAHPPCAVLAALGAKLQYEIAVGLNGVIWVNASSAGTCVLVANAVQACSDKSEAQARIHVENLLRGIG